MTGLLERIESFLRATTPQGAVRTTRNVAPDAMIEVSRQPVLLCTADLLRLPAPIAELTLIEVTADSEVTFTARLCGAGAATGMYLQPLAAVTELVGIATLEPMRGKGIGAALTAALAVHALADGVDLLFLATDNPVAQRVYERIGFRPVGEIVEYVKLSINQRRVSKDG